MLHSEIGLKDYSLSSATNLLSDVVARIAGEADDKARGHGAEYSFFFASR